VVGVGAYPSTGYQSRYLGERRVAEWCEGKGPDASLLEILHEIASRGPRPIVFPDNDDGVEFLLDHWEEVRGLADLPLPDDSDVVRQLRQKDRLPAVAAAAGIPAPRTVYAASEERVRSAGLQPPLLVKPVEGKRFVHLFGEKVFLAASVDAAVEGWRRADREGIQTIVQELIPDAAGSIWSLFVYLGRGGAPLAAVVGKKRRELPPVFGSSTVFEGCWNERVYRTGIELLHAVDYCGFAHVELAHDRRDDSLQLIEVNTRIPVWASIAMGPRLNMAKVAYQDLCGNPPAALQRLGNAVTWIDLQEELARFASVRVGPAELLRPFLAFRKARALFAADDPWPGVAAAGRYVRTRAVRPLLAGRRWLRTRLAVQRARARLRR
jgi:predicted ATP-grasp superfamily ATP-dependent carboligase